MLHVRVPTGRDGGITHRLCQWPALPGVPTFARSAPWLSCREFESQQDDVWQLLLGAQRLPRDPVGGSIGCEGPPTFCGAPSNSYPYPPSPPPARSFGFLRRWPLRLHLASFDRPTDRPTTLAGGFHFLRLDGSVFESTVPLTLARSSSSEPSSPTHRERASYELLLTTFWLPSSYGTMT